MHFFFSYEFLHWSYFHTLSFWTSSAKQLPFALNFVSCQRGFDNMNRETMWHILEIYRLLCKAVWLWRIFVKKENIPLLSFYSLYFFSTVLISPSLLLLVRTDPLTLSVSWYSDFATDSHCLRAAKGAWREAVRTIRSHNLQAQTKNCRGPYKSLCDLDNPR